MDQFVEAHLDRWLYAEESNEEARRAIRAAMIVQFDSDPDFYGNHTWRVCYDAIGGLAIHQLFEEEHVNTTTD